MTDFNTFRFRLQNTRKHRKPVCGVIPRYRDAHLGSSGATKDGSCPGLRRPTPRFDLTLNLTATAPLKPPKLICFLHFLTTLAALHLSCYVLLLDLSRHSEAQVLVPKQTRAKDRIMSSWAATRSPCPNVLPCLISWKGNVIHFESFLQQVPDAAQNVPTFKRTALILNDLGICFPYVVSKKQQRTTNGQCRFAKPFQLSFSCKVNHKVISLVP